MLCPHLAVAISYYDSERLDNLPKQHLSTLQKNLFDFIENSELRHHELLHAINRNNCADSRSISAFSDKIGSLAQADSDMRFFRVIRARLQFSDMPERLENIPKAHQDTFSWIFRPANAHPDDQSWNSFTEWLRNSNGQNLYWITGKSIQSLSRRHTKGFTREARLR